MPMNSETEKAYSVSSTWANMAYVNKTTTTNPETGIVSTTLRLTFGEAADERIFYRTAITMPEHAAKELRDTLLRLYPPEVPEEKLAN